MDLPGQKLAEQICLYIILASGVASFAVGYLFASFALMIQVCNKLYRLEETFGLDYAYTMV